MLDSKALQSIPLVPANTAPPAPNYPWPEPSTSAMFLSFDVDAESAWTSKDALHAERLITMSMGVAVSGCDGKSEIEALLNQADAGLYVAKENGRNRIEYFIGPAPASERVSAKQKVSARARKG